MLGEGKVYDGGLAGPGSEVALSFGRTKALRTNTVHGQHYDSCARGAIFHGGIAGSGIAPGTSLTTTAQAILVYNPTGSGVNVNVLRFAHAYVSGTFGLGFWVMANYSTLQPGTNLAPGGTACVVHAADGGIGGNKALLWNAATVTAAPIFVEAFDWEGVLDGTGATQVGSSREFFFDGSCIAKPGTAKVFTYVGGAGTTPKVAVSLRWEEIPILGA